MSNSISVSVDMGALPKAMVQDQINPHVVAHAAAEAINVAGPYVMRRLALNTPVGATGKARQSVTFEPPTPHGFGQMTGFVGYGAPASLYIGFANDGTRAHFPPITPLTYWAARKLGDPRLGFLIARSIARFGTRPQYFVERTRDEVEATAVAMMRRAFTGFFDQFTGIGGG